jgi:copper chaperone CopZ
MRIRTVAAAVVLGFLLPGVGGSALAEVQKLSFPVKGLVSPLGTRGVEESIKRLRGVASVRADLATGRVEVEAQAGQTLNIEEIRLRSARAGFPVNGELDMLARGRFAIGADGRITFRVIGTPYSWQVLEGQRLLALFRGSPTLSGEYLAGFRLHDRPPNVRPAIALTRAERVGQPVARAGGR